jgi:hypothetical protein
MWHKAPDLPMLVDLYTEVMETRPAAGKWQPSRIDWFVARKDWDGFVDFGNNKLVVAEPSGTFRVSQRYGGRLDGAHFDTAVEAMATLDTSRLDTRRFVLYNTEEDRGPDRPDSCNGYICGEGAMFRGGFCVVQRYGGASANLEHHPDMAAWLKDLPEHYRVAWVDPENGPTR